MSAPLLAILIVSTTPAGDASMAGAVRIQDRAERASPAFASEPLGDAALERIHGTGVLRPSTTRLIVDGGQTGFFRQTSEASRITFDNWWAQPGAALIAENILASRLR